MLVCYYVVFLRLCKVLEFEIHCQHSNIQRYKHCVQTNTKEINSYIVKALLQIEKLTAKPLYTIYVNFSIFQSQNFMGPKSLCLD